MKTTKLSLALGLIFLTATAAAATTQGSAAKAPAPAGNAGATGIVERNIAARGGLQAWRAVQTLVLTGRLEAGGKKNTPLPFVMEMKRPHKSRLEIKFRDQTALQIYDGAHGWKARPFLNRNEIEDFTPAEAKMAQNWAELDGMLVDYASKGTRVALLGTESVEGRKAYKLQLTLKDGTERKLWIDAATFLETKIEGDPRKMDGKMHAVNIFYRDYRPESGLIMPHVLETVVDGVRQSHKMTVEQVAVNRPLEDSVFGKPQLTLAATSR